MMKSEISFYRNCIEQNFWPYWSQFIDHTNGGIYTCITNDGTKLLSTEKYTWSQGRFLWLCASLYECVVNGQLKLDIYELESAARKTAEFLQTYAIIDDKSIAFLLKENGDVVEEVKDESIFADCFFVLGLTKYAGVFNDQSAYLQAKEIFNSIMDRIGQKSFKTQPYPTPEGFESQSIEMIIVNVAQELAEVELKFDKSMEFALVAKAKSELLLSKFNDDNNRIIEYYTEDITLKETILATHINPGHTIEAIWFHIHLYEMIEQLSPNIVDQCNQLLKNSFSIGWDNEFGGLRRFVLDELKEPIFPMEQLILDTHDTKLWWPHSETLYTSLLLYELTNDNRFLEMYLKTKDYVFANFPNKELGEWIQILDRKGQPLNKVVALPVKDPFHILRNFILIVRRWSK